MPAPLAEFLRQLGPPQSVWSQGWACFLALLLDIQHIPYYDVRIRLAMAVATLTSKGQITIPSRVRAALGLEAGDRVEFIEHGRGQFAIVAATSSVRELKGLFQRKRNKPVSIEEMNTAIARHAGSR